MFFAGTPKCHHSVNEIVKQAVYEADLYRQAGVVSIRQNQNTCIYDVQCGERVFMPRENSKGPD